MKSHQKEQELPSGAMPEFGGGNSRRRYKPKTIAHQAKLSGKTILN